MGILRPNKATPHTPVSGASRDITSLPWTDAYRSTAGETVTRDAALSLPAVWRAVSLVAEILSSLPIDVVRENKDGTRVQLHNKPRVITEPSLRLRRREWVFEYVVSMMLDGNSVGVVVARNAFGFPDVIEWIDYRTICIVDENQLALPVYYVDGKVVAREDIVHARNFLLPGTVEGLSPVEYHAETLGLGLAARKYGSRYFGDGAHPTAVLSTEMKLTPEQASNMKKGFVASLRGKREPAVLGSGIKYSKIQDDPEQAQLLAIMARNTNDVARILGVPVEYLGGAPEGSGSLTYANREQRWQDFVVTCLMHYGGRLEEVLSESIVRGQVAKINYDAVLRGDTMTRYNAYALGLTNGFLELNEVRALEDLSPIEAKPEPVVPAPAPVESKEVPNE